MRLQEFILTDKKNRIELTDNLSQDERIRREIWKELKDEGKTDKEIVELFLSFGL